MDDDDTKRYEKVDLRLPMGMRDKVRAKGEQEQRSLNGQVVYYVESGLRGYGPLDIAIELRAIRLELAEIKALLKNHN